MVIYNLFTPLGSWVKNNLPIYLKKRAKLPEMSNGQVQPELQ